MRIKNFVVPLALLAVLAAVPSATYASSGNRWDGWFRDCDWPKWKTGHHYNKNRSAHKPVYNVWPRHTSSSVNAQVYQKQEFDGGHRSRVDMHQEASIDIGNESVEAEQHLSGRGGDASQEQRLSLSSSNWGWGW